MTFISTFFTCSTKYMPFLIHNKEQPICYLYEFLLCFLIFLYHPKYAEDINELDFTSYNLNKKVIHNTVRWRIAIKVLFIKVSFLSFSWFWLFMVFNATFNNISIKSWRSVLLAGETRVTGENHRPVTSHRQILSHMLNRVHLACVGFELTT